MTKFNPKIFSIIFIGVLSIVLLAVFANNYSRKSIAQTASIKPQLAGVIDRQGEPNGTTYSSSVNGFVVKNYDATQTDTTWSELQPQQGGTIAANNTIDKAIANARAKNMHIKLRVYAGLGAPAWVKNLPVTSGQAGPFQICNKNGVCGTVGHFWEANYRQAYKDLQTKLAAKYDGVAEVEEVAITGCSTTYGEPLLRESNVAANIVNYKRAGYNEAANQACEHDQIVAHNVWNQTRSSLAFNPYDQYSSASSSFTINEDYTETLINDCRNTLGSRCVLGNNSIGKKMTTFNCSDIGAAGWSTRDNYGRMYTKIQCVGKPIYFQTATPANISSAGTTLRDTLTWAASLGAGMVELPSGYDKPGTSSVYISPADMVSLDRALEANALPGQGQPNPTVTSTVTLPPTTTVAPGSASFSLNLLLHGIGQGGDSANPVSGGNPNPLRQQRTVIVEVYSANNQLVLSKNGSVNFNSTTGSFAGTIDMGTLSSGVYIVKIKSDQFLRAQASGIQTITQGVVNSIPQTVMVNGDINGDNNINILDYNIFAGCYSDLLPAASCTPANKTLSDITDDGDVNSFDYNLFLRELNNVRGS